MKRNTFGIVLVGACLVACADDDEAPRCVSALPESCTPLYEPTFDNVFAQTFTRSCAVSGGACHAPEGAQGGLALGDPDLAYDLLLSPTDAEPRVIAGDPACSKLVVRLVSSGADVMPPGSPLAATEQCSVIEWIRRGAVR